MLAVLRHRAAALVAGAGGADRVRAAARALGRRPPRRRDRHRLGRARRTSPPSAPWSAASRSSSPRRSASSRRRCPAAGRRRRGRRVRRRLRAHRAGRRRGRATPRSCPCWRSALFLFASPASALLTSVPRPERVEAPADAAVGGHDRARRAADPLAARRGGRDRPRALPEPRRVRRRRHLVPPPHAPWPTLTEAAVPSLLTGQAPDHRAGRLDRTTPTTSSRCWRRPTSSRCMERRPSCARTTAVPPTVDGEDARTPARAPGFGDLLGERPDALDRPRRPGPDEPAGLDDFAEEVGPDERRPTTATTEPAEPSRPTTGREASAARRRPAAAPPRPGRTPHRRRSTPARVRPSTSCT